MSVCWYVSDLLSSQNAAQGHFIVGTTYKSWLVAKYLAPIVILLLWLLRRRAINSGKARGESPPPPWNQVFKRHSPIRHETKWNVSKAWLTIGYRFSNDLEIEVWDYNINKSLTHFNLFASGATYLSSDSSVHIFTKHLNMNRLRYLVNFLTGFRIQSFPFLEWLSYQELSLPYYLPIDEMKIWEMQTASSRFELGSPRLFPPPKKNNKKKNKR